MNGMYFPRRICFLPLEFFFPTIKFLFLFIHREPLIWKFTFNFYQWFEYLFQDRIAHSEKKTWSWICLVTANKNLPKHSPYPPDIKIWKKILYIICCLEIWFIVKECKWMKQNVTKYSYFLVFHFKNC